MQAQQIQERNTVIGQQAFPEFYYKINYLLSVVNNYFIKHLSKLI